MKLLLALSVDVMAKGVIVLHFLLSFSMAKLFLVDMKDETLEDADDPVGNDYGNTS